MKVTLRDQKGDLVVLIEKPNAPQVWIDCCTAAITIDDLEAILKACDIEVEKKGESE